jgi:hypothetical protein
MLKRISSNKQEKESQGDTRICYRGSTSHLEVYVSVEKLIKDGLMHQAPFLSLATTKIDLEPLNV